MKFKLWREYGAQNSKPIFDAIELSLQKRGHQIVNSNQDIDVIWSVLFYGRMTGNKTVWETAKKQNRNVLVLEVGSIERGKTWKVGLNGINRDADFGDVNNTSDRAKELNLKLVEWRTNGEFILICGQHDKSLQWQNQPTISNWFMKTYDKIRKYTDRPIIFRPHPRCKLPAIEYDLKNVYRQEPKHLVGTYDDFDMSFDNIWATVNWSSNPGIHSVLHGIPSFVSTHSIAYPVANDIDFLHDIENPLMPNRVQWLNDYAWTEYTIEEISQGLPLERLTTKLL